MIAKRLRQFRKLFKVLASADYRAAFRRAGVAAAIEHEPLLRSLDFRTVVDIGANRGQFSLATRHCYPKARIFAFEPLAAPGQKFQDVHGEDSLVTLYPVAVGPTSSRATMHVTAEDDSSSLLPVTALQQSLFSGTNEVATAEIEVAPLAAKIGAEELLAPALLKIDVQGYELPVLEGCESLLDRFSNLYVECSFVELYSGQALAGEVVSWLGQRGFQLVGAYNAQYDSKELAIQADLLFSRIKA